MDKSILDECKQILHAWYEVNGIFCRGMEERDNGLRFKFSIDNMLLMVPLPGMRITAVGPDAPNREWGRNRIAAFIVYSELDYFDMMNLHILTAYELRIRDTQED